MDALLSGEFNPEAADNIAEACGMITEEQAGILSRHIRSGDQQALGMALETFIRSYWTNRSKETAINTAERELSGNH